MKFALIPSGRFTMGSSPSESGRNSDERHVEVAISHNVYLSVTEVTQSQWATVMGDNYVPPEGVHPNEQGSRRFLGDTLPAYVSWLEAAEYCRRLSQREDAHYRLPTEAEWEYACRSGSTTSFHAGDALDPTTANVDADQTSGAAKPLRRPMPVGSYAPNAWGLYDMHGNVMEWCADWLAPYPLGPLTDPTGPSEGTVRVLRGGSWDGYARIARSANRWANYPVLRTEYVGFRVALDPHSKAPANETPYLIDRPELSAASQQSHPSAETPSASSGTVKLDPLLPSYEPRLVLDHRIRSAGSDTMDRLFQLWERRFQNWHQQVEFRHEGLGSGTAVPALVEGIAHIGPMSRPLNSAESRQFQAEYGYELVQLRVAIDALAIYVHPSNPIAGRNMTLAELDAILSTTRKRGNSREISKWGDLGLSGQWADRPIHVYGRNPASGTYGVVRETVLSGGDFKPSIYELVGSAEVLEAVADDPVGIGYSGIGYVRDDVRTIPLSSESGIPAVGPTPDAAYNGTYPLSRPMFLTIDQPPDKPLTPLIREFLRFVYSKEGQQVVIDAGFFPLTRALAAAEIQKLGPAVSR